MEFLTLCLLGGFVPGCLIFGILHEMRQNDKKARSRQKCAALKIEKEIAKNEK